MPEREEKDAGHQAPVFGHDHQECKSHDSVRKCVHANSPKLLVCCEHSAFIIMSDVALYLNALVIAQEVFHF